MPSVCGACPLVQAVFQKMLENPSAIGPRFASGAIRSGSKTTLVWTTRSPAEVAAFSYLFAAIARLDDDIRDLPGLHALGPYLAAERKLPAA